MDATLKFPTRIQAETFVTNWGRYSKRGHTMGAGLLNVDVKVFDLSDKDIEWINNYVANCTDEV